jgi:glycosyltransferase involved in cell wall biosynthesis
MSVVVLQTTIPAYRQRVFDLLYDRLSGDLELLAGSEYFDPTLKLEIDHPRLDLVANHFLLGRRMLWQSGVFGRVVHSDVAVLELNPRILSSWPILIARRLTRRRTLLWGHAWPRSGKRSRSEPIRHLMRSFASGVIVYTERQADELRRRMPGKPVYAAPNALYPRELRWTQRRASATNVLFVGRLVEAKKPGLLLDAFLGVIDELPPEMDLVFVGDGPLRAQLGELATASDAGDRVRFVGAVTRYDQLRELYESALVSVSSGYAGLSLIQSFWFGVPAIIARDELHSPEIEAAEVDENCVFVDSGSVETLGRALASVASQRETWLRRRESIAERCADRYALETMADRIVDALALDGQLRPHTRSSAS